MATGSGVDETKDELTRLDVDGAALRVHERIEDALRAAAVVLAATSVALSFATVFVPTVGRTTVVESFLLGTLLYPAELNHALVSVAAALSVLMFLVAVFQPRADTPSVNTNYLSGACNIVVMFATLTWSALCAASTKSGAAAATESENESESELAQWTRLACPLAACFLVAYGDSQRVGLHASTFVFARCCRYAEPGTPKRPRTLGGAFLVVGTAWPVVVRAAVADDHRPSFVDVGLLVLALLHVGAQIVSGRLGFG